MAREAVDILFELGEAGHRADDQKLKSLADELTRVAGDLSRAVQERPLTPAPLPLPRGRGMPKVG